MNNLKEIYEEVAVFSKDSYETNHKLEKEVADMIKPYTMNLSGREKEALEDIFYDVCAEGKYVGFCIGMKYCFKIGRASCRERV